MYIAMAYTAAGLKAHGARGLKIGVTGVTRVALSSILLIFMVFIAVTPLCAAIKMKCYKLSRCYISRILTCRSFTALRGAFVAGDFECKWSGWRFNMSIFCSESGLLRYTSGKI